MLIDIMLEYTADFSEPTSRLFLGISEGTLELGPYLGFA